MALMNEAEYNKRMSGPSEKIITLMHQTIAARNLFRRKDDPAYGSPGSGEAVKAWEDFIETYEALKSEIAAPAPSGRAESGERLTTEQIEENKLIAKNQFSQLKGAGQVTCTCGRTIPARFAYKCLYCDIFRCLVCSEDHFGKTRAQYFAERANPAPTQAQPAPSADPLLEAARQAAEYNVDWVVVALHGNPLIDGDLMRKNWRAMQAYVKSRPQGEAPIPTAPGQDIEINMPDGVVRVFGYAHQTKDAPDFFDRVAKSVRVMVESGMIRFRSGNPGEGANAAPGAGL